MKKILVLGFALSLLSCSSEDQNSNDSITRQTNTIDTTIDYESPYNLNSSYGNGLENGKIIYTMENTTNLLLKFQPVFGFAFYDGANDLDHWGNDLTSSSTYSPNLIENGNEYGNYIASNSATGIHLTNAAIQYNSTTTVPLQSATTNGFYFDYNYAGQTILPFESSIISSRGKLFYITFDIYDMNNVDANNSPVYIAGTYLKAPFPMVDRDYIYSEPYPWKNMNLIDSRLGEKLIYNVETKEICIPNTQDSTYKSKMRFTYLGNTYEVGIKSNEYEVKIYLFQL